MEKRKNNILFTAIFVAIFISFCATTISAYADSNRSFTTTGEFVHSLIVADEN